MQQPSEYKNRIHQFWKLITKEQRLPQTPCINCGIMVSLTKEDSIDTKLPVWETLVTPEYITNYADLRLHTRLQLQHQRMCYTCHLQLKRNEGDKLKFKRCFKQQGYLLPTSYSQLYNLNPLERNIIALIAPFARLHQTSNRHGLHGGVTLVEIPLFKFGKDVYLKSLQDYYYAIGYLFRHPDAVVPWKNGMINRTRFLNALRLLIETHPAYNPLKSRLFDTPNSQDVSLHNYISIEEDELQTDEDIYTIPTLTIDIATQDTPDTLLIEWRPDSASPRFIQDDLLRPLQVNNEKIGIETLAFPYLFPTGKGNFQDFQNILPFAEYAYLRQHNYYSFANADSMYVAWLFSEKFRSTTYSRINFLFAQPNRWNKNDVESGTLLEVRNQKLAIRIHHSLPGTRPYLNNCYQELLSLSYYKLPTVFLTFTMNPEDSTLQRYIQHMRQYRPIELQQTEDKMIDLFPQLQFTRHHFKNLLRLITNPNFWYGNQCLHQTYVIEYHQQSGYPHCHAILWIDLPYNFHDIKIHGDVAETWLLNFWDSILSTNPIDAPTYSFCQYHECLKTRCKRTKRTNRCRSGFPHIPLPQSVISIPATKENIIPKKKCDKIRYKIERFLEQQGQHLTAVEFYKTLNITQQDIQSYLDSTTPSIRFWPKREPRNARVNSFHPFLLEYCAKANMDFTPIYNIEGIGQYLSKYFTKGKSNNADKNGQLQTNIPQTPRQWLQHYNYNVWNSTKVTMSEMMWRNAKFPTFYIKDKPATTNLLGLTHNLLKIASDLTNVHQDSKDIFTNPDYAYYQKRPSDLETQCFADFISLYSYKAKQQNALFTIECVSAGQPIQRHYRRYAGDRTIKFFFHPWGSTPDNDYYMYIFFYPWREVETILCWKKCNENIQQVIYNNFIRHRGFQKTYYQDVIDKEQQFDTTSSNSDSDCEPLAINSYNPTSEEILDAPISTHGQFNITEFLQNYHQNITSSINQLNSRQAFLIATVGERLLHSKPYRIIIQGKAGTGKTYMIHLLTYLIRFAYLAEYQHIIPVVKTAMTGAAAYLINGSTVHSTFNQPPYGQLQHNYWETAQSKKNKLTDLIHRLKTWILDECWMCGHHRMCVILNMFQQLRKPHQPLNYINILLFGDINQVEPIGDDHLSSGSEILQFECCELVEPMRQADDPPFANMLSNLIQGKMTDNDWELLEECRNDNSTDFDWATSVETTAIYRRNADAEDFNDIIQQKHFASPLYKYNSIPHTSEHRFINHQIPTTLNLAPNMRVILLHNISVTKGFTNGAIGTIRNCHSNAIEVQFKQGSKIIKRQNINERMQIPLRMAYGMTACKVQGQEIQHLVRVDGLNMKNSEIYTSLSRCRNRHQLEFRNITKSQFEMLHPHNYENYMRQKDIFHHLPRYWNLPHSDHIRISYAFIQQTRNNNGRLLLLLHTAILRESNIIILTSTAKFTQRFTEEWKQLATHHNRHHAQRIGSQLLVWGAKITKQINSTQFDFKLTEKITFSIHFGAQKSSSTNFQIQYSNNEWDRPIFHNCSIQQHLTKPFDVLNIQELETNDIQLHTTSSPNSNKQKDVQEFNPNLDIPSNKRQRKV